MKFKQYLLNEGRSKTISEKEAYDLLTKNCMEAVKKWKEGKRIYRAVNNNSNFLFIDPSGSLRTSYFTSNHYTLIINNHPMWKKFPKRQIICSGGSGERAMNHGYSPPYYVFPYDGAKIGVCPADDIWESFEELRSFNIYDLNFFNNLMDSTFNLPDDNWNMFEMEAENINVRDEFPKHALRDYFNTLNVSLFDFITKMLDPKLNNFKLQKISNYNVNPNENLEVWTDSKCILADFDGAEGIIE